MTEDEALQVGDNGVGAPNLGSVSTANSYGVAAPTSYLRRHFGNDPANYLKNPDAWYQEQGQISKQFQNNPAAQIGAEPAPTPSLPPPSAASWTSTPDQTSDETGYDQSFRHLGGYGAAINA